MGVKETLNLLKEKYKVPRKDCVCITVTLLVENIGLFDAIVEHSGRCCLPSTEKAKQGVVKLIVSPYFVEETFKLLQKVKKTAVPELEIVKVEENCFRIYGKDNQKEESV
jgi:hypothetical protein